jgi:hypothetical protein
MRIKVVWRAKGLKAVIYVLYSFLKYNPEA